MHLKIEECLIAIAIAVIAEVISYVITKGKPPELISLIFRKIKLSPSVAFLRLAEGILISILIVIILSNVPFWEPPTPSSPPSPSYTPSPSPSMTPTPTPSPSTSPSSSLGKPQSPYGQALQKEQLGQASYKDWEKANIVTETYYARNIDKKTPQPWYTSTHYNDENTGYRIGLYYADGLLFFAAACHVGERDAVTFYFWDGHMFACQDIIGGETDLSYEGSSTYNRIVEQFGDIYAKSQQYAQDAK